MAYGDDPAPTFSNPQDAPPVTVESLLRHHKKYGLENTGKGYKGRTVRYKNYAALRKDALVHTARTFLTEAAYLQLLEGIGYPGHDAQAREDWRTLHGQE